MRFCDDHWERLRQAISDRGLDHLVAPDAETAVAQAVQELEQGQSPVTYDPLMAAMWGISSNVMRTLGPNSLYLVADGPEDPLNVEDYPGFEHFAGRTWPKCPLCYIGLAHEMTCDDPRCVLPAEDGYAWMIDRAADEQAELVKEGLTGEDDMANGRRGND